MTDTAKPMTRDEAEKAARAGAKVRSGDWTLREWATMVDGEFVDENGRPWNKWHSFPADGWSIVEPAPDTAKAETDAPDAYDRVKWAEGLIRQLPENHDGRNSWLLNFGEGPDVEAMRDKHPLYRAMEKAKTTTTRNAPEPWRPTIGRDAVTRDGRRARNVRANDASGSDWCVFADLDVAGDGHCFLADGSWAKGGHHAYDLVSDWVEPEQAETPKRKWGPWKICLGSKTLEYYLDMGAEIRVLRRGDTFLIKRRVKL